jgi:predicted metal-dependent hydrolase
VRTVTVCSCAGGAIQSAAAARGQGQVDGSDGNAAAPEAHIGKRTLTKKPPQQTNPEDLKWTVRHWAARIGVTIAQIHLRPMKRKWASISTAGRLTLDTDLLPLPAELAEFVVVHELVHLLAPNHGKVFNSFMDAYLPDWQERERRLAQCAVRQGRKRLCSG